MLLHKNCPSFRVESRLRDLRIVWLKNCVTYKLRDLRISLLTNYETHELSDFQITYIIICDSNYLNRQTGGGTNSQWLIYSGTYYSYFVWTIL